MTAQLSVGTAQQHYSQCSGINETTESLHCNDTVSNKLGSKNEIQNAQESPILERAKEEQEHQLKWFSITPHKVNYLLPITNNVSSDFSPYGEFGGLFSDTEIKFQLSFKTRLWSDLWKNSSLWIGYTQQSYWQLYSDDKASAPFRETNHEPELIWQIPLQFKAFGFNARVASLAFNHQSNGQPDPLSRSWNRITGEIAFDRNNYVLSAKTWTRIDGSKNDDNPAISDFSGRIELGLAYKSGNHTLAIGLKNSLNSENRSGVEVNWLFPLVSHLRGFLQLYSGYGENLINMEDYSSRIGIGVALTDWL